MVNDKLNVILLLILLSGHDDMTKRQHEHVKCNRVKYRDHRDLSYIRKDDGKTKTKIIKSINPMKQKMTK